MRGPIVRTLQFPPSVSFWCIPLPPVSTTIPCVQEKGIQHERFTHPVVLTVDEQVCPAPSLTCAKSCRNSSSRSCYVNERLDPSFFKPQERKISSSCSGFQTL